jgi:hypothetical protein
VSVTTLMQEWQYSRSATKRILGQIHTER